MIAMQLMSLPITFIGGAVSQVYLSHGGDRLSSGELALHTKESIILLLKIGFFPILGVCFVGPYFIPYVFGGEWGRTGEMLIWMFPWFMVQLLVSPVSMALYLLNMQRQALYLQVLGLVIRVLGLLFLGLYEASYLFEYYAVSSFVFYSLYLLFIIFIVKGR